MSAQTLQVIYFDGHTPAGSPATILLGAQEVAVVGERISERYAASALRVSPRVASSERFVALPDGGQLQCRDHPALETLPQEVSSEGPIAWLEQRWPVAIGCVVLVAGLLAGGYWYGLPVAAERIAARIPIESERTLGEEALAWLDARSVLTPTSLEQEEQDRLREGFNRLIRGLPYEHRYGLEFRGAPRIGANALAFPGGIIVVTDDLVHLSDSDEEALAVLAHEIGHVELRHALRQVLQTSAVAVAASTLTGDAMSLGTAVAGLPAVLAQLQYSREFEVEADSYAFELLKRHGISPLAFASMMQRLAAESGVDGEDLAFLSSHPVTAERIDRARAAAGQ